MVTLKGKVQSCWHHRYVLFLNVPIVVRDAMFCFPLPFVFPQFCFIFGPWLGCSTFAISDINI